MSERIRSFIADTLALIVFFTIVSGLNERFVAGMGWEEVAMSRSIGALLMVMTARPYGVWRDWFLTKVGSPSGSVQLIADGFALLSFQVPIYLFIIVVSGAQGMGIVWGTIGFAAWMLLLGRPYGIWLEFVRRKFGLTGVGRKPMSLGG